MSKKITSWDVEDEYRKLHDLNLAKKDLHNQMMKKKMRGELKTVERRPNENYFDHYNRALRENDLLPERPERLPGESYSDYRVRCFKNYWDWREEQENEDSSSDDFDEDEFY